MLSGEVDVIGRGRCAQKTEQPLNVALRFCVVVFLFTLLSLFPILSPSSPVSHRFTYSLFLYHTLSFTIALPLDPSLSASVYHSFFLFTPLSLLPSSPSLIRLSLLSSCPLYLHFSLSFLSSSPDLSSSFCLSHFLSLSQPSPLDRLFPSPPSLFVSVCLFFFFYPTFSPPILSSSQFLPLFFIFTPLSLSLMSLCLSVCPLSSEKNIFASSWPSYTNKNIRKSGQFSHKFNPERRHLICKLQTEKNPKKQKHHKRLTDISYRPISNFNKTCLNTHRRIYTNTYAMVFIL